MGKILSKVAWLVPVSYAAAHNTFASHRVAGFGKDVENACIRSIGPSKHS